MITNWEIDKVKVTHLVAFYVCIFNGEKNHYIENKIVLRIGFYYNIIGNLFL